MDLPLKPVSPSSSLSALDTSVLEIIRQIRAAPPNDLRQNPDSPLVAVFADWLISRGDPRGAFIASRNPSFPQSAELESLESFALEGLTTTDISGCAPYFNCGFLTTLVGASSNYAEFIERVSKDLTGAFFRELSLPPESLEDALATRPLWPKTRELNVIERCWEQGPDPLRGLSVSPGEFAELEVINFVMGVSSGDCIFSGLIHQISEGLPRLDALKELTVHCPRYAVEDDLLGVPHLSHHRVQQVSDLLVEISTVPAMAGLERLAVGAFPLRLRPGVFGALLQSPHLPSLKSLELDLFLSEDDVVELLFSGQSRPNTTKLILRAPERGDALVSLILGETPVFTNLSTLSVRRGSGSFPLKALELLLGRAWVSPLRRLEISLGDADIAMWRRAVNLIHWGLGRQLLLEECLVVLDPVAAPADYTTHLDAVYSEDIEYDSPKGPRTCRIRVERAF